MVVVVIFRRVEWGMTGIYPLKSVLPARDQVSGCRDQEKTSIVEVKDV